MTWVNVTPKPSHKCAKLPDAFSTTKAVGTILECDGCKKRVQLVRHEDNRDGVWKSWEVIK